MVTNLNVVSTKVTFKRGSPNRVKAKILRKYTKIKKGVRKHA